MSVQLLQTDRFISKAKAAHAEAHLAVDGHEDNGEVDIGYGNSSNSSSDYGHDDNGYGHDDNGCDPYDNGHGYEVNGYGHDDNGYGHDDNGCDSYDNGYGHEVNGYGHDDNGYGHDDNGYGHDDNGYGHDNVAEPVVDCGVAPVITNAVNGFPGPNTPILFGEQVWYDCDPGYSTDDGVDFGATCQEDGTFTEMVGACTPLVS